METYIYNGRRLDKSMLPLFGRHNAGSRTRYIKLLVVFVIFSILGLYYQFTQEERLLKESWTKQTAAYNSDCYVTVAMGSDLASSRGLFASINSIISNYSGGEDEKLCIYVFSTKADLQTREQGINCVFGGKLSSNVHIHHRTIDQSQWNPQIFTEQDELMHEDAREYLYMRYYLKPSDVDGTQRVIWIDSDTIVRGDVKTLYEWELKGKPIAAANYWEPLKNYLCTNPRLNRIKMKTPYGKTSPFNVKNNLNTGLMVIDLYQMQKRRILDKFHNLVISHEFDCLWNDEAGREKGFDLALEGEYIELPSVWNVGHLGQGELLRVSLNDDACQQAKMLHFNGMNKPYSVGRSSSLCVHFFDEYDIIATDQKSHCLQ